MSTYINFAAGSLIDESNGGKDVVSVEVLIKVKGRNGNIIRGCHEEFSGKSEVEFKRRVILHEEEE